MKAEECIISRREVAKLAGVSEATVSRVLNGVGPIREETKLKVLEAARQLNYVPNVLAQQLARRRSGNLGVILPYVPKVKLFSTYYFAEILSGIGETARRMGYDLLIIPLSPVEARSYTNLFQTQKVDACIMLGSQDSAEEREALRQLHEEGYPFCLVNQHFDDEPFKTIEADHVKGGQLAATHLIERGCRRIAFLNGPNVYSNSRDRMKGYSLALQEYGIELDEQLLYLGNYSRKSGYQYAGQLAEAIREGQVDGIVAANDRMAIGLLQGLREHGVKPGRDAALIGYDDAEGARFTEPQLSSVAVPFYEMGEQAAQWLLDSLHAPSFQPDAADSGEPAEHQGAKDAAQSVVRLPVRLVPRASSLRYPNWQGDS
ncbi:LacI family DNA-binding transcriptional regulator [Paenibacillus sp. GCM10012307]|uniref:LacI family DNA-binding transcriptional regulator n=2 Tax=Paenibacillus roseus TaxID=2798579 RepID=A0A934J699_9BACL|nr:LacI family DNA-binding transcriptional regulator [Paenibacillus roseus]